MNKKEWIVLLLLYLLYLLLGSVAFLFLELPKEQRDRQALIGVKKGIIDAVNNISAEYVSSMEDVMSAVSGECGHDFLDLGEEEPMTWNLWNSFFFTFTVITTIGYGHMSPSTPWGKVFCIIYAIVGVPFNGILFTTLADFFYTKIVLGYGKIRQREYDSTLRVLLDSIKLLLPGLIVFFFLPSALFMYLEEEWSYLDAFYFSFITLSTIGFGDYVAGRAEGDPWLWLYKFAIFIWITFGLGYLIMIITFITKALGHKKVIRMEKRLAKALKKHAGKVNNSMQNDLRRLREIMSAMIVMENKRRQEEENDMDGQINSGFTMSSDAQPSPNLSEHKHVQELLEQISELPGQANNPIRRAHSDASLYHNKKPSRFSAVPLESVKYFFTMAETLLQEQQVSNYREADKAAHDLVIETITDDCDEDYNNIDPEAAASNDPDKDSNDSLEMNKKIGYENEAYIDEEDILHKGVSNSTIFDKKKNQFQQLDFHKFNSHDNGINKFNASTFSEILDKLECIYCNEKKSGSNPFANQKTDSLQNRRTSFSDMLNLYCNHHSHLHNINKRRHSIPYLRNVSVATEATNLSETPTTDLDSPQIFPLPTINFKSSPSVLEQNSEKQAQLQSTNLEFQTLDNKDEK
ncbi:unnamed protein product [Meganyctiphanes norvegica]|uniref:Potassium channel domain-containing protein n=1 Tax=Meganyctiphanes norvegica TaxID=48144 RepID=A0AAV2PKC1_MEGNR